jgi:acyl-CoA reductase-like NAD-dependent aldehyde dehydrogenase
MGRADQRRQLEIVNPNSEEVVARVAEAGPDDMDRAVAAARQAFDHGPWPTTPPAERGAKLMAMIDLLEPRVPELSAAVGRPGRRASPASRRSCTAAASPGCAGSPALGHSFPWVEQKKGMVVGHRGDRARAGRCVAGIAPWNAPFGIMANKVFYALVSGCTIVMKPSPEDAARGLHIAEAAEAAGPAAGHGQPCPRRARGERPPRQQPRHRQGQLHRLDRRGQAHRRRSAAAHRPLHARARRQVGGDRARRFPDRGRRRASSATPSP